MKLYELTSQYQQLLDMAEELDEQVFQDTVEGIQENIYDKAENISRLLQNMSGDIEALKAEEKRLAERRRAMEKKQANLKSYLLHQMIAADVEKVPSTLFKISIRNNPPKVVVDEDKLTTDYMIARYSPDKKRLKELLSNGEEIEGAQLVREKGLVIK